LKLWHSNFPKTNHHQKKGGCENVAFSLTKEKPISAPFQSQYGWHIVKFIEKFQVKTAKEMQQELNAKISKDERSRKITNSVNGKLRKEYPIKTDAKVYNEALLTVTAAFTANTWKAPTDNKFSSTLFAIKNKKIAAKDFLNYLEAQQKSYKDSKADIKKIVSDLYEKFIDEQLNAYYDENLENNFPEFANVIEEYKDGLLLFDLMEKEIWEKAKNDSIGLKGFYDLNKQKYTWKNRLDVSIASSTKREVIEKTMAMFKADKSTDEIKKALNTDKTVEVMINQGIFEEGNSVLPKNVPFNTGVTETIKNGNYFYVTKVNKTLPASSKTFEEAKGKVINEYQQYLEENWISNLKKEFDIKINQDVFEKIKTTLQSK
jgi:peptidyl-prolyl cis-trans isomerase SurA